MKQKSIPILAALTLSACSSIPNAQEAEVMINGNCDMCEETIEGAATVAGMSSADWDQETRKALITFDSTRTTLDAVLKRIADAGYDNQSYTAPDSAYADLPECCQYERTGKTVNPPQPGESGHGH